jgi:hypothetical protein
MNLFYLNGGFRANRFTPDFSGECSPALCFDCLRAQPAYLTLLHYNAKVRRFRRVYYVKFFVYPVYFRRFFLLWSAPRRERPWGAPVGSALGVRPEGSALGVRPEGSALGVRPEGSALGVRPKEVPLGCAPKGAPLGCGP